MARPRAFACAGVVRAEVRSGRAGGTSSEGGCLVVCGGYDDAGEPLASMEGSQVPDVDHFAELPARYRYA
eukprot:1782004-Rhodomonas_salina.1